MKTLKRKPQVNTDPVLTAEERSHSLTIEEIEQRIAEGDVKSLPKLNADQWKLVLGEHQSDLANALGALTRDPDDIPNTPYISKEQYEDLDQKSGQIKTVEITDPALAPNKHKLVRGVSVDVEKDGELEKKAVSFEDGTALVNSKAQDVNPYGFTPKHIGDRKVDIPEPEGSVLDYYDRLAKLLDRGPTRVQTEESFKQEVIGSLVGIDEARHHPQTANRKMAADNTDTSFTLKSASGDMMQFRHPDKDYGDAIRQRSEQMASALNQHGNLNGIRSADQFFQYLVGTKATQGQTLIYSVQKDGAKQNYRVRPNYWDNSTIDNSEASKLKRAALFLERVSNRIAKGTFKTAMATAKGVDIAVQTSFAITNNTLEVLMAGNSPVHRQNLMPITFKSTFFDSFQIKGMAVPREITAREWIKTCAAFDRILQSAQLVEKDGTSLGWDPRKIEIMTDFAHKMKHYSGFLYKTERDGQMHAGDPRKEYWRKERERFEKDWLAASFSESERRFKQTLMNQARLNGPVYRSFYEDAMLGTPLAKAIEHKLLQESRYL